MFASVTDLPRMSDVVACFSRLFADRGLELCCTLSELTGKLFLVSVGAYHGCQLPSSAGRSFKCEQTPG